MEGLGVWGSGDGSVEASVLEASAAGWLAGSCGVLGCEDVLAENLVETVADLAFVAGTDAQLGELGFDPLQAVEVWDHLAPVVAALGGAPDGDRVSLTVHVVRARNLAKMDLRSSDPYVILKCGGAEKKTEVVKKNLDPEWKDARFQFDDVQSSGDLVAEVFDWDRGASDDPMGKVTIPLLGLESKTEWFALQPMPGVKKAKGELQMTCTVLPPAAAPDPSPEATEAPAPAPKSIFARKREQQSKAQPDADLDADVAAWLAGCGAPECEAAFREAMVETLGDVAFLVSTRADLSEMGLSEPQVDTLWEHVAALAPGELEGDDEPEPIDLTMDASTWLADHGQDGAEPVLRENLIETVEDLTFLISSERDMEKLGFAPRAIMDLWPSIAKLRTAEKPKRAKSKRGAAVNRPAKSKGKGKAKGAEPKEKAKQQPKPKPSKAKDSQAAEKKSAAKKAAAKEAKEAKEQEQKEKKAAAQAKKKAKKERDAQAAQEAKAQAQEAKAKKKAAAEARAAKKKEKKEKAAAAAKKKRETAAASPPKRSARPRRSGASSRLYSSDLKKNTMGPGAEVPRSEKEMSPRKRGKARPPRCATVPHRVIESGKEEGDFSPRLEWEVQKKLLYKLEQQQRRNEELQWRKEQAERKAEEEAKEREELRANYEWELNGPAKIQVGASVENPKQPMAGARGPKMSPGSAKLLKTRGDGGAMSFIERQEHAKAVRAAKLEERRKRLEEEKESELKFTPVLSRATISMMKEQDTFASLNLTKEEVDEKRLERLTSPVRVRDTKSPRERTRERTASRRLGSPQLGSPSRRTRSKRVSSPPARRGGSSVEKLSKDTRRTTQRLRRQGQTGSSELSFQPAVNSGGRSRRRRSPRSSGPSPARSLGSPSRTGIASALSSIKANIKSVWDQPGGVNIEKLFEHYDKDQDGWLSYSEWCRAVRRDGVAVGSGQHLTDDDHKAIFDYVDADADGYISLTEFRQFLRPKSRRRSSPRQAADKSRGNASAASDGDDSGLRLASPVSQLAAALSAPPAPASLPAASAELIEHCAEWVARHGQQFETILKNRNFGQPGWEFLFTTDTVSAGFYRQRLEYEMQQQISESAKRCETIYTDLTAEAQPEAAAAPQPQPEPEPEATADGQAADDYEVFPFNDS